jgi:hypothetical protein
MMIEDLRLAKEERTLGDLGARSDNKTRNRC